MKRPGSELRAILFWGVLIGLGLGGCSERQDQQKQQDRQEELPQLSDSNYASTSFEKQMRTTRYAVQIQDLLTALEDSNVVLTQLVDDIKRHDDQYLLLLHQSSRLPSVKYALECGEDMVVALLNQERWRYVFRLDSYLIAALDSVTLDTSAVLHGRCVRVVPRTTR